jgi:hypothetical protein
MGGSLTGGGIRWSPFLNLETQVLQYGTVTGVEPVSSRIKADHALALLLFEGFLPASEMVIKGLG